MRTRVAARVATVTARSTSVVAVQFCPTYLDLAMNLQRLEGLAALASSRFAPDIIVFPELATTGYELTPDLAASMMFKTGPTPADMDPRLVRLQDVARQLGSTLVFGFVEQCCDCGTLHNSSILLTPQGDQLVVRKKNLFGPDWLWAKPGCTPTTTFKLGPNGPRLGLLICKDISNRLPPWDPDYEADNDKRLISEGDTDIVICTAAWGKGEFPANSWMEFVFETQTWLVMADRHGQEREMSFQGGTCIISPDWEVNYAGLTPRQDSMVYQMIPGRVTL